MFNSGVMLVGGGQVGRRLVAGMFAMSGQVGRRRVGWSVGGGQVGQQQAG
jgi:hypothetical protein